MPTAKSVQDLIDAIHIDVIGRKVERKHDLIRERYEVPKFIVDDYEDFKSIVTGYYQYHFSAMFKSGAEMPDYMAHNHAEIILENMYPPDPRLTNVRGYLDKRGSYMQAYKNALRGRHGGLVAVIDEIADAMKKEAVDRYISSVFLEYINPTDYDTCVAFMREYIDRYGHVALPGEDLESPYLLATKIEVVIQNHVRVINELWTSLQ